MLVCDIYLLPLFPTSNAAHLNDQRQLLTFLNIQQEVDVSTFGTLRTEVRPSTGTDTSTITTMHHIFVIANNLIILNNSLYGDSWRWLDHRFMEFSSLRFSIGDV